MIKIDFSIVILTLKNKVFEIDSLKSASSLSNEILELRKEIIEARGFDRSLYENEINQLQKIDNVVRALYFKYEKED